MPAFCHPPPPSEKSSSMSMASSSTTSAYHILRLPDELLECIVSFITISDRFTCRGNYAPKLIRLPTACLWQVCTRVSDHHFPMHPPSGLIQTSSSKTSHALTLVVGSFARIRLVLYCLPYAFLRRKLEGMFKRYTLGPFSGDGLFRILNELSAQPSHNVTQLDMETFEGRFNLDTMCHFFPSSEVS